MQNGPRKIVKRRSAGLDNTARYWKGERAEVIVHTRRDQRLAEKAAKAAARRKGKPAKALTPQRELTRLRRALPKRKTLEARQRIQARIAELESC